VEEKEKESSHRERETAAGLKEEVFFAWPVLHREGEKSQGVLIEREGRREVTASSRGKAVGEENDCQHDAKKKKYPDQRATPVLRGGIPFWTSRKGLQI